MAVKKVYLQICAEKKAEIGQCKTEHKALATIPYYAAKLPVHVPLTNSELGILSSAHSQNYST